jgi:hypothetical protein
MYVPKCFQTNITKEELIKKMKNKETLEEAVFKLYPKTNTHFDRLDEVDGNAYYRSIFRNGVKWQQEQDKNKYSEEEVLKAQQAILCNIKDALMDENYIIEYLNNL